MQFTCYALLRPASLIVTAREHQLYPQGIDRTTVLLFTVACLVILHYVQDDKKTFFIAMTVTRPG